MGELPDHRPRLIAMSGDCEPPPARSCRRRRNAQHLGPGAGVQAFDADASNDQIFEDMSKEVN